MSDQIQSIIPGDERILLSSVKNQLEEVLSTLNNLYAGSKITQISVEEDDRIKFYDQGSNFESVCCHSCKKELDTDYWLEFMDKAGESEFTKLDIYLPCCNLTSSLNELDYKFPAGFARSAIKISNPNNDQIIFEYIKEFEDKLELKLKVVTAHY